MSIHAQPARSQPRNGDHASHSLYSPASFPEHFPMPIARLALIPLLLALVACATVPEGPAHPGERYWDRLEPGSVSNTVPVAEQRLADLFGGELSPERCTRHREALEHALERIPVDLIGLHTARECAALLGDDEWGTLAATQLDALIDYALAEGRGRSEWNPAPILEAYDIGVIAELRGLAINWIRYLPVTGGRYWLLEASMTDQTSGRERRYYFDLMEAMKRLYIEDPADDFPSTRRGMAHLRLEADALGGDPLALTGYLYMDVDTGETNPAAAKRALEHAWEGGVPAAAMMLGALCLTQPEARCEPGALDNYINGLRELEVAEGWALEAVMLAREAGKGPGDPEFDAALARAGEHAAPERMAGYVAALLAAADPSPSPEMNSSIDELLRRASAGGSADAWLMRFSRLPIERQTAEDPDALAWLTAAADAGHPRGHYTLGALKGFNTEAGYEHLRAAFRRGLPEAALVMALVVSDTALRLELLRRAAFGGNGDATMMLAQYELTFVDNAPDLERAREWLVSGTLLGHVGATARLAALFWRYPALNPEHEQTAMDLVQALYDEAGPDAAMRVPTLLADVSPYNESPGAGIALLKRMSDAGMAEATLRLADQARDGDGMQMNLEAAAEWYRLADSQGAEDAIYQLGDLHAFDLDDPDTALALYEQAADAGHEMAANNRSWLLCTGQFGAERDPLRGLSEIETTLRQLDTPHPYLLSTLAACQAALGDFESARKNLRHALDRSLAELPDETEAHEQMRERMKLYEADQPYIWRP